jgi:hypothetical protein
MVVVVVDGGGVAALHYYDVLDHVFLLFLLMPDTLKTLC